MAYSVKIKLSFASATFGPKGTFDLYSNVDGFVTPFESCVTRDELENGYTSHKVPEGTQIVRAQTNCSDCDTSVDMILIVPTPSITPSITKSISITKTPTVTMTKTPSPTKTITPTTTPSSTVSFTPSYTPSITITRTVTATVTPTQFLTPSVTPSITPSIPKPIPGTRLANSSEEACYAPVVPIYTLDGTVRPGIILYVDPYFLQNVTGYNHVKLEDGTIYTLNTITGYVGNDTGNRCKGNVPSTTPSITWTVTPSVTKTPSVTPSITPTNSITPSQTPSISMTPSISITPTITPSISATPSITPSISAI